MSAIRVGNAGGYGRTGLAVSDAIAGDEEFELATLRVSPGWLTHVDNGSPSPSVPVVDNVPDFVQQSDVVIDFTMAEAILDLASTCAVRGVALVSGRTGLGREHLAAKDLTSTRVPVLWSPNMSAGIAAIMALLPGATSALRDYDIEIIETYHRGSAMRLLEQHWRWLVVSSSKTGHRRSQYIPSALGVTQGPIQ